MLRERVSAGVGVIFSSHQLDLVERLCDEVAIIRAGRIVAAGTVDQLRTSGQARQLRVRVDGAPGWATRPPLAGAGVRIVSDSGNGAVIVELPEHVDDQAVLDAARAAGRVREFVPAQPTLAELFRTVVSDGNHEREREGVRMTRALSFREAVTVVARREFMSRLRERSFLISTLVTLGIIALVVALPQLIGADEDAYDVAYVGEQAGAVAEVAEQQAEVADIALREVEVASAEAAEAQVREGELDAYVLTDPDRAEVVVDRELDPSLRVVLDTAYRAVAGNAALTEAGLDPADVATALDVPPLDVQRLDPDAEEAEMRGNIAFIGSILLYAQLLGYGFWVATGVVEEKSSRVVELLLSAIPARAFLAGKVLGIGMLGLLQLLLISVVGVGIGVAMGAVELSGVVLQPILYVLGFFVLGYLVYACLMAAAAARVTRQEELQNVTTPVTTLAVLSFFATFQVAQNPDATLSKALSIVPPVSALTMPVRVARGDVAVWEVLLSIVLLVAAIAVLVIIAGRVYQGAVLRMGAKVSWREALRSRG